MTHPTGTGHPELRYDPNTITVDEAFLYALDPSTSCTVSVRLGVDMYNFGFRATRPYTLGADEVYRALRGDVDAVEVDLTSHAGRTVNVRIALPRPNATPEELAAEAERRAALVQRAAEEKSLRKQRRIADLTAWNTLRQYLTPAQRKELDSSSSITVVGSAGNTYRINTTHGSGNVGWCDESGHVKGWLCAHLTRKHGYVPLADHILAQLLEIVVDEPNWVSIAHGAGGSIHPAKRTS